MSIRQLGEGARLRALTAAALLAGLAASSAAPAAAAPSYVFGRIGGNIAPYTVTIAADGAVTATGAAQPSVTALPPRTLASLAATAAAVRFSTLPRVVACPGTLPDVASFFVTVRSGGTQRTVRVHGGCSPRFNRLARALALAVGVRY